MHRPTAHASLLLACGLLGLGACGSDAKSTPETLAIASSAPTPDTIAAAGGDDCGADVVANVTAQETSDAITAIKIIGGCSSLDIATSLADDDISAALAICDNAAKVAYVGTVKGITVEAKSGKEVSIGVKGSPCIGEP